MTSVRIPAPEFLSPRRDIRDDERPWTIRQARIDQGGATSVATKEMFVPFGDDPYSRWVRAHEMVHARVSPADAEVRSLFPELDPMWVDAGEEFRVNQIVRRAGFNNDAITMGHEHLWGIQAARNDDWQSMVYMTGRWGGTGAFSEFVRGVESVNGTYAELLNALENKILDYVETIDNTALADTTPSKMFPGVPRGFTRYARSIAEMLAQAAGLSKPAVTDQGEALNLGTDFETLLPLYKSGTAGWAQLVLDTSVVLDRRLSGKLGRKRIATDVGRNPRRINRMLTDPNRRVFDRYTKGQGGVVLIDQSGSMSLTDENINRLLEAAPGCVIIGYSHEPGSTDVPNVWVLADRGKVASEIPVGHGGNGVDGPAVRFALSKRRTGEPFVWVCDGYVTNRDDDHSSVLDSEITALVKQHNIHMTYNVSEAVKALQRAARGERLQARTTGSL